MTVGDEMHDLAAELFPICRSLTGNGVRRTFEILKRHAPGLETFEVPSGTQAFDWTIPDEWNLHSAVLTDPDGRVVADAAAHNLHVVGYSEPVDTDIDLEDLQEHLYSLPDNVEAIPYVTSYYTRRWGFCLTHAQRQALKAGRYHAKIDATLEPGSLTYGEIVLKGESDEEVLLSTYICHPSMANNELSGPVVATYLARWLASAPRHYTYRLVFIPETIGSIVYLSRNLDAMKAKTVAGFNITCIGDDRCYSYLPSRAGDTLADRAALHVLSHIDPSYLTYSWLDRGSDERQYCAPGIDLPVATIMRSKYLCYPEYHTSLDDLTVVTPSGLEGGLTALKRAIEVVEGNVTPRMLVLGEPQLGKRGLYPTISTRESGTTVRTMMNLISYCDGRRSLLEIAELIGVPMWELTPIIARLEEHDLVELTR